MINKKNAEFRAMLTEATNASFDCGEYEFYAGEKVEENYADLEEKSTATRAKVIETYAALERENARLRDALREALDCAAYTVSVDAILDHSTRHIGLERLSRHRSLLPDAVDACPDSALPNVV